MVNTRSTTTEGDEVTDTAQSQPATAVEPTERTQPDVLNQFRQFWQVEKVTLMEQLQVEWSTSLAELRLAMQNDWTQFMNDFRTVVSSLPQQSRVSNESSSSGNPTQPSTGLTTKPVFKPKAYDGTVEWDAYKLQFEGIAAQNGWDDQTKTVALESALTGAALEVLPQVETMTYNNLVKVLEKRFGHCNHSQRFMATLLTRKQALKEDVTAYHLAVSTLARRAWPTGVKDNPAEEMVAYNFVQGLRDHTLRDKVLGVWPKTLDEALTVAVRFETVAQANSPQLPTVRCVTGQEIERKVSEETVPPASVSEEVPVSVRMAKTQQRDQSRPRQQGFPQRQIMCWRCSQPGHVARFCPFPPLQAMFQAGTIPNNSFMNNMPYTPQIQFPGWQPQRPLALPQPPSPGNAKRSE